MDFNSLPLAPFHLLPDNVRRAWATVAAMPFENLTKVLKQEQESRDTPIRLPTEVLADHRRFGTGATCFALAFLLRHLLLRHEIPATLHTCDRRYGQDVHAAVAVSTPAGGRWLFDPGYHIVQPIPDEGELRFRSPDNPNSSCIRRLDDIRYECYTGHAGTWRLRFVFKDSPLDDSTYRQVWRRSFQADMMAYPVLTRFESGRMLYLQKSNLVIRDFNSGQVERIAPSDLVGAIRRYYGISPEIAKRALRRWESM